MIECTSGSICALAMHNVDCDSALAEHMGKDERKLSLHCHVPLM